MLSVLEQQHLLYQKPISLCQNPTAEELRFLQEDRDMFISLSKEKIENEIKAMGIIFRAATFDDMLPIETFISIRYPEEIADEISAYDLYRFIEFGHGMVLQSPSGNIAGCVFEIGYDTPDKTSYSIRLGVDKSLSGKDLGKLLANYSCLQAMERGSLVKRAILDVDNYTTLNIQLNKIGWLCDGFYKNLKGLGTCFTICLPLTPDGLVRNKIDSGKLVDFIKENQAGTDYLLIDAEDIQSLTDIYSNTIFKVAAFVKSGLVTDRNQFLALPINIPVFTRQS